LLSCPTSSPTTSTQYLLRPVSTKHAVHPSARPSNHPLALHCLDGCSFIEMRFISRPMQEGALHMCIACSRTLSFSFSNVSLSLPLPPPCPALPCPALPLHPLASLMTVHVMSCHVMAWPGLGMGCCVGVAVLQCNAENLPSLNNVLMTVVNGCSLSDLQAARGCFVILVRLAELWGGGNEATRCPGFNSFLMEQVAPVAIQCPARPDFNFHDGQSMAVLGESVSLQKTLFSRLGAPFVTHMSERVLVSLGFDAAARQEYSLQLQSADAKTFKNWFKTFLERRRSGNIGRLS